MICGRLQAAWKGHGKRHAEEETSFRRELQRIQRLQKTISSQAEGLDQEDHSLRPAQANSSRYSISKITKATWAGGVAQAVQYLLCKCEALSSNSSPTGGKKKKRQFQVKKKRREAFQS
jgi:hypothetical protein